MQIRVVAALLAAGLALAYAGSSPADDGGSGTYAVSGSSYDFNLFDSGTTQWQYFVLTGPAGTTFVGGATQGEITARCVAGQPDGQANEIECGPLTVAPGAHVLFVATVTAPGSCSATFGLTVIPVGGTSGTNVGGLTASGSCAAAPPAPRLVTAPKLRGTPVAGGRLASTAPQWSAPATGVGYQWQVCAKSGCRAIAGATGPSLRLTAAEVGRSVRLAVSATVSGVRLSATSGRLTVRAR